MKRSRELSDFIDAIKTDYPSHYFENDRMVQRAWKKLTIDDKKALFDSYMSPFALFGHTKEKLHCSDKVVEAIKDYGYKGCQERGIDVTILHYWVYCLSNPAKNLREVESRKKVISQLFAQEK